MLERIVSHLQTAFEDHSSQQHREQGSLFSNQGHQQHQVTSLSCIVILELEKGQSVFWKQKEKEKRRNKNNPNANKFCCVINYLGAESLRES